MALWTSAEITLFPLPYLDWSLVFYQTSDVRPGYTFSMGSLMQWLENGDYLVYNCTAVSLRRYRDLKPLAWKVSVKI